MKRTFTRILSVLLAVVMCAGTLTSIVSAADTNLYHGDKLSAEVKAGKNGYTFMSVYYTPYAAYEMSNHMVNPAGTTGGQEIPQTLMLVDASSDYTWRPNGTYSFGSSNYEVLYCCDIETGYEKNTYYKRLNLEDNDYYTPEKARHIRNILMNSYPYVSLEEMKASLKANGFEYADDLTRADVIAAVQTAVWAFANDAKDYVYFRTFNVPDNTHWGGVLHDYTAEMQPIWWKTGKSKVTYPSESEEARLTGIRIDALVDYLKEVGPVSPEDKQIVISQLEIVDAIPVIAKENTYTVALRVKLNNSGSTAEDDVTLTIYADDKAIQAQKVVLGTDTYDFIIEAKADQIIKATAAGTQILPTGVYFYEPEGGRRVSQCLVGVGAGETDIHTEKEVRLEIEEEPVTANLSLRKVDHYGNALHGASFDLYVTTNNEHLKVASYAVDNNGELTIENLLPGNYELVEAQVPFGFVAPSAAIRFIVDKDGKLSVEENNIVALADDGTVVITNNPITTTVSGSKTWDDSNNQDGKRPESIIVNLFANGVQVDSKTVTEADGWAWTFADLDKYADGVEILYTISEEPVEGYVPTINGYDITNSYEPEQTYVSGRKIWNDDNNRDGVRPDSIVIRLWADGVQIDSKVVTAADAWAWYFFDLDKYQNGREIDYTITEDPVPGYTTTIAYGVVTNTYIPETTSIPVSKVWNDNNNQDGVRPNSITVTLLADGVDTGLSVVLSAVNGWKSAFTDLPRYENNAEINYSVVESSVEGYVSTITGNAANGFEIINSRETAKITVSGTKTWIDNDNETGIRPESITINLHANGAVIASKTVSEADGWAWTFADLDMYADGKEIAYTITENVVDGYMTEVHGYDVINYLTETPEDFEEFEEIEDEDVPLASPQTADVASLWAVSALVSGGAVKFIRRKKHYEDD